MLQGPLVNLTGVVEHIEKKKKSLRLIVKTETGAFTVITSQVVKTGQYVQVQGTLRRRLTCSGSYYEILADSITVSPQESPHG